MGNSRSVLRKVSEMYRVADIVFDLPAFGDMPRRMASYEVSSGVPAFMLKENDFRFSRWDDLEDIDQRYYMETGKVFYTRLLQYNGMMLHASAVAIGGYAYLFCGPSGMGKSTHTKMYLKTFGEKAVIINDDKPAVRKTGGVWYAYGTPWCGKDGININERVRLGGICFLRRGDTRITRLDLQSTIPYLAGHTLRYIGPDEMARQLKVMEQLAGEVPAFEFFNHADSGDAGLTYSVMKAAAEAAFGRV